MKKLNTTAISNELLNSSFFPKEPLKTPTEEAPVRPPVVVDKQKKLPPKRPVVKPTPVASTSPVKPTPAATPMSSPAGRRYVRRTFDFFDDQIAYLTKASLEERMAGKEGSMNAMVREALDAFIETRKKK